MYAENAVVIRAPLRTIFDTAADLSLWPVILPHYRWIRFLERSADRAVVVMAARRKWIPIQWTSEYRIDREKKEMHFFHLKAFTRGMRVVWTFTQMQGGVNVRIEHNLEPRIPFIGRFIAERIIGQFFIGYVANQTLQHMKRHIEERSNA